MTELRLPLAWQDWRITEELGEGAYGRVYRAEKENGGVKAVSAIKVIQVPSERSELLSLRREFTSDEELRQNLKEMVDGYANEIRAMYRLQGHTHIVSIQDHLVEELDDGLGWRILIRMEYLRSFNDYALTHSLSREEIIRLGISLCEALDACAASGILHRDIKPENLFVTDSGQFKLGDFGVAKALDKTVRSYSSKGTFSYMAPEVFRGKPYDTRADLYSTGMILYKLTNRNRDPFIDPEKQIITQRDREQAMGLRMQGEKLPAPVDADEKLAKVVLKACEFEPKNRYASPGEMMQALKELPQQKKEPAGKPWRKWILPLCAAAVLLVAGIAVFLGRTAGSPPNQGDPAASATPVPAEIEGRIQEYCGVRYILPEGFVRDENAGHGETVVWKRDDLAILFQVDQQEYKPTETGKRTIGGFEACYNPQAKPFTERKTFVFATYANPLPEKGGAVYVILQGYEQDIADAGGEFIRMLDEAERIAETSLLPDQ